MSYGAALKNLRNKPTTSSVGTRWTDEEEVQLLKEVMSNTSIDQIALIHKRTTKGITARLRQIAVGLIEKGVPEETASKITGLSTDDIYGAVPPTKIPKEDLSLVQKLELVEISFKETKGENEALRVQADAYEEKVKHLDEEIQRLREQTISYEKIIEELKAKVAFYEFQPISTSSETKTFSTLDDLSLI